jgi:hypothetical protein
LIGKALAALGRRSEPQLASAADLSPASDRRPRRARARLLLLGLLALAAVTYLAAAALAADRTQTSTFDGSDTSAGPFQGLERLAIHQQSATIYAIDVRGGNDVIDKFDASGAAQDFSALSSSSLDGSAVPAPDGPVSFDLSADSDLAVDNSGTASDGRIYVLSEYGTTTQTVFAFDPAGNYLYKISVGAATDPCGVATDSSGHLWVSDYVSETVIEYDATGAPTGNTIDTSAQGNPCHIAFDSNDNLYVALYNGALEKYDSSGAFQAEIDPATTYAVTTDLSTDHVFAVHLDHVSEYDSAGAPVSSFGSSNLSSAVGAAINPADGDAYVADEADDLIHHFELGALPLPIVTTADATAITATTATLNGSVDPQSIAVTDCHFEYVDDAEFQANGFINATDAACVPDPGSGSGAVAVSADVAGLSGGIHYHFRLVAANANGTATGARKQFDTSPAVQKVQTDPATAIAYTTATLNGTVDPGGIPISDCHFDYTDDADFQAHGFSSAATAPCVPDPGSGSGDVAVHADLTGLDPQTTYHFRLSASNAYGTTLGGERSFTTAGPVGVETTGSDGSIYRTATTAELSGRVDPNGAATTYHFDYGTDDS